MEAELTASKSGDLPSAVSTRPTRTKAEEEEEDVSDIEDELKKLKDDLK